MFLDSMMKLKNIVAIGLRSYGVYHKLISLLSGLCRCINTSQQTVSFCFEDCQKNCNFVFVLYFNGKEKSFESLPCICKLVICIRYKYSCVPTSAFVPSLLPQLYSVDIIWYYSANHNTYINTENHTARIHNYSIITKNTLYNDTIINYCYIEQCQ